jgi:Transglutaminase-like superfamily
VKHARHAAAALIVLFLVGSAYVQEAKVYKAIDQHALNAPAEAEESLESLAKYLVAPGKTDRDKARAIFRWIADRVAYDAESFFAQKQEDNSPEGVLKSRKAVCAGYANLFADLARRVGLEVATVSGYAKGVGYDPDKKLTQTNHAWNAVRLDGDWQLIDATWGAGYLKDKEFVKRFTPLYFLIDPEKLIFSHLPADDKWQLRTPLLEMDEFWQQPKVDRGLWELGVAPDAVRKAMAAKQFREFVHVYTFPNQTTALVKAPLEKQLHAGSKYTFEIKSDDFIELVAHQEMGSLPFTRKGNIFRATVQPRKGEMRIAGKTKDDLRRYTGMLQYVVE